MSNDKYQFLVRMTNSKHASTKKTQRRYTAVFLADSDTLKQMSGHGPQYSQLHHLADHLIDILSIPSRPMPTIKATGS